MHFTPTYSSWLNQVERSFALITDEAIRRGSFTSVKQLVHCIDHFVSNYKEQCRPSSGPPPLTPSFTNSSDFAHVLPEQDTSSGT